MLEMMKEWKNNPGSDEESPTDQKNKLSSQEKLEVHRPSRSSKHLQAVTSTSEEEEPKQVGRAIALFLQPCPFGGWFGTKALYDKAK